MEIITLKSETLNFSMTVEPFVKKYVQAEKKINKIEHKTLREIIYDISGGATPTAKGDSYLEAGNDRAIPFLRIQNIGENELIQENLNFINPDTHYKYLKRSILKQDDILVTITGRVGTACVVEKGFKGNINQHIVRFSIIDSYDPYFISLFINSKIGKLLTNQFVTGGTRIALDYETLLNLKIPAIDLDDQETIVQLYQNVRKILLNIQNQCNKIKLSIEPFLLKTLGISRNTNKKESLLFSSADILNRFDYLNVNAQKRSQLKFSGKSIELGEIVFNYKRGNSPKPEEIQAELEDKQGFYPMLRIQDISQENRLQFPTEVFVQKYIKGFNYSFLSNNDLIFCITGATIGKVAIVDKLPEKIMLGNDMIAMYFINGACNPAFVYYLFTISFYQDELKTSVTGQTNGHLDPEDILAIRIPDIDNKEQDNIVKVIKEKFINKIEIKEKLINEIKTKSNNIIEELILGQKSLQQAENEIKLIIKDIDKSP